MLSFGKEKIHVKVEFNSIEDPLYQLLIGRFLTYYDVDDEHIVISQVSKYLLAEKDVLKLDPNHVSQAKDSEIFKQQKEKIDNITDEMQDFVNKHYHLYSNHRFNDFSSPNFRIQSALDDYHIVVENRHLWDGKTRPYDCPLCNWKKPPLKLLKSDPEHDSEPLSESQLQVLTQWFE